MKFILDKFVAAAENERQIYITLGAVNNTKNEAFGIPTLYHYGRWKNCIMIAVTVLDSEFEYRRRTLQWTVLDKLIVFREWVSSLSFLLT